MKLKQRIKKLIDRQKEYDEVVVKLALVDTIRESIYTWINRDSDLDVN